jgi:hypothetical protein
MLRLEIPDDRVAETARETALEGTELRPNTERGGSGQIEDLVRKLGLAETHRRIEMIANLIYKTRKQYDNCAKIIIN